MSVVRGLATLTPEADDRFAVVKLHFRLPNDSYFWPFIRAYPRAIVSIIASQDLSRNRVLANLDIFGPVDEHFLDVIRESAGVVSASPLGSRGPRTRLQVIAQRPAYLTLASRLETLLRYPRIIQNGWYTVEVVTRVPRLSELVAELRRITEPVEVQCFGRDPMRTFPPTLTAQQHALLHQALAAGYFDVPRKITLTELASRLHRAKSSLSQSLARIERELAESSALPNR